VRTALVPTPIFLDDSTSPQRRCLAPYVPLGLLSLSAVLEQEGLDHDVIDLNRLLPVNPLRNPGQFVEETSELLARLNYDVYGFSTVSRSYPEVLGIARRLKELKPSGMVVFGGAHASVVHRETLTFFPFVDAIIRGEGEIALPRFLKVASARGKWKTVPNLSYREGHLVRVNPETHRVADLNSLPIPAYHRFAISTEALTPIDVGRGCPFKCTYCSTSLFWQRTPRIKRPERIVEELTALAGTYGCRDFIFDLDTFTFNPRYVRETCQAIIDSGLDVHWECYARITGIDEKNLERMRRAGCRRILFGIETVSPRLQRSIRKVCSANRIRRTIREVMDAGIQPTLGFIIGFPDETEADIDQNLAFINELIALGADDYRMNRLRCYPGTELFEKSEGGLVLAPDWRLFLPELDGVNMPPGVHKRLFPDAYWLPNSHYRLEYFDFIHRFFLTYPRTCLALFQHFGGTREMFQHWEHPPATASWDHFALGAKAYVERMEDLVAAEMPPWKNIFDFESARKAALEAFHTEEIALYAAAQARNSYDPSGGGPGLEMSSVPSWKRNVKWLKYPREFLPAIPLHRAVGSELDSVQSSVVDILLYPKNAERRMGASSLGTMILNPAARAFLNSIDGQQTLGSLITQFLCETTDDPEEAVTQLTGLLELTRRLCQLGLMGFAAEKSAMNGEDQIKKERREEETAKSDP
jgi:radical SAM superfamily enzyme YgiQ (UPF0313 family)